jgi:hypothetical protein
MSAVIQMHRDDATCGSDTSHVESAIALLHATREEGARRAAAYGSLVRAARDIRESVDIDCLATDMDDVIDTVQREILDAFVRIACERFAAPGCTLSIDASDYRDLYLVGRHANEERRDNFCPRVLWSHLARDWGAGRGERESYTQAAQAIARFFYLKRDAAVEQVRGHVVLKKSVYCDGFYKKWNNANRMSYSSRSDFDPIAKHFETFSAWANLPCFGAAYREHIAKWDTHPDIVSRERFPLGAHAALVTYLHRVEFHFTPTLATALQLFLQTYAWDEESEE